MWGDSGCVRSWRVRKDAQRPAPSPQSFVPEELDRGPCFGRIVPPGNIGDQGHRTAKLPVPPRSPWILTLPSQAVTRCLPQHLAASSALELSWDPVRVRVLTRLFGLEPETSFLASSKPTPISSYCFFGQGALLGTAAIYVVPMLALMSPGHGQFYEWNLSRT